MELAFAGLFIQAAFVENFVLSNFLGMCSFLSCSARVKTANGLGLAVVFVTTCSGLINWFVHAYITAPGALSWAFSDPPDLSFLETLIFITVIASFTQITEIVVDNVSPTLYRSLGIYLPLIAVNCAVLGIGLFTIIREYTLAQSIVYIAGSSVGWWLAIVLMAAIREKLQYSDPPKGFEGFPLTFVTAGLMAIAFLGFAGISLTRT